jgi:hypothetical protein
MAHLIQIQLGTFIHEKRDVLAAFLPSEATKDLHYFLQIIYRPFNAVVIQNILISDLIKTKIAISNGCHLAKLIMLTQHFLKNTTGHNEWRTSVFACKNARRETFLVSIVWGTGKCMFMILV